MSEDQNPLEIVRARRAEREAEETRLRDAQLAVDLTAIDELEATHGASNVKVIVLPYTKGLPAAAAVRTPKPAEVKRYRDRVKPDRKGNPPDYAEHGAELAAVCLLYPDKETYAKLCEARSGLPVQLGTAALELATGAESEAGKG